MRVDGRGRWTMMTSLLVAGLAALPVARAAGQGQPSGKYRVAGTVVDQDGHTIASAEVDAIASDSVARRARTDSVGGFAISGLSSASIVLRIRRLGFETKSVIVSANTADNVAHVVIDLEPSVTRLNGVEVDESPPDSTDTRLAAFKIRAASNTFGHYVDWNALAKLHPQYASDALRGVPGIVLRPSRRIGNITRLRSCGVNGQSNERVGPLIWVDGVRVPGAELDETVQANDIAAIEVYSSFAGIPSQFFDRTAVCGTIVVWTKIR